jgi:SH3-like domain-containing protein
MRATARNWVTVRAAASRSSRVIASIGPDTRVQLGEARGEWMRIRMKGINGWVERSRF